MDGLNCSSNVEILPMKNFARRHFNIETDRISNMFGYGKNRNYYIIDIQIPEYATVTCDTGVFYVDKFKVTNRRVLEEISDGEKLESVKADIYNWYWVADYNPTQELIEYANNEVKKLNITIEENLKIHRKLEEEKRKIDDAKREKIKKLRWCDWFSYMVGQSDIDGFIQSLSTTR